MNSLAIVIAPVVHSVVFEWNQANHIHSFPHWEDLIDTDRARIVDLVTFAINNPNASELMLYNNFKTTEFTWEELSEVDKKTWMLYYSTIQVLTAEV